MVPPIAVGRLRDRRRIAEAEDRALHMLVPKRSSQRDFFLMQARLRALVSGKPAESLKYFDDRKRRADVDEEEVEAIEYGSSIALQQQGKFEAARKSLENLLAHDPHLTFELLRNRTAMDATVVAYKGSNPALIAVTVLTSLDDSDLEAVGLRVTRLRDVNGVVWYLRNANSPGAPDLGPFAYGLRTWKAVYRPVIRLKRL